MDNEDFFDGKELLLSQQYKVDAELEMALGHDDLSRARGLDLKLEGITKENERRIIAAQEGIAALPEDAADKGYAVAWRTFPFTEREDNLYCCEYWETVLRSAE